MSEEKKRRRRRATPNTPKEKDNYLRLRRESLEKGEYLFRDEGSHLRRETFFDVYWEEEEEDELAIKK